MADPRDVSAKPPKESAPARPQRAESALPIAGRSGTVAEIGRELGDLDFEPDDLLASLRPMEPDEAQALPAATASLHSNDGVNLPDGAVSEQVEALQGAGVSSFSAVEAALAHPGVSLSATALGNPTFSTAGLVASEPPRQDSSATIRTDTAEPQALPTPRARQITFETVPNESAPLTLAPPTLGHGLNRAVSIPSLPPDSSVEAPEDGPYVMASEEAATLEELIELPPDRLEALTFPHERPASSHLDQLGLTEAFSELAQLLDTEANANRHTQERAELAFVASELFAMTGQHEQALQSLARAPKIGISALSTQLRQLSFNPDDLSTYAKLLRSELRASVSHEARRHLMALFADVAQRLDVDVTEQRRHLELSLRAFPTDPRFQLQRLAAQLGDLPQPSVRLRQPTPHETLGHPETVRDLVRLRSQSPTQAEASHPLFAGLLARHALRDGRTAEVIGALSQLAQSPSSLSGAATWLLVALSHRSPMHHALVASLLEKLAEAGDEDAELSWLEHQLNSSDVRTTSLEVFSLGVVGRLAAEDQLAIAVAVKADLETIRLLVDRVAASAAAQPGLSPLALSLQQAVFGRVSSDEIDRVALAQLHLGSSLAAFPTSTPSSALSWEQPGLSLDALRAISEIETAGAGNTLTSTLRLWHSTHGDALTATATNLIALAPVWPELEVGAVRVLAALLAELDGNRFEALSILRSGFEHQNSFEVVARALLAYSPESPSVPLFETLIASLPEGLRRTLLELELVQRRSTESRASDDESDNHWLDSAVNSQDPARSLLLPLLGVSLDRSAVWQKLATRACAADERQFLSLLDHFEAAARSDDALSQARHATLGLDSRERDAAASTCLAPPGILSTLDQATCSLQAEATQLTLDLWARLAAETSSPMALQHSDSLAECLGGDLERFEAAIARAGSADDPEEFLQFVAHAAALDPERESAVGSTRAAELLLQRFPSHLASLRTKLLSAATAGRNDEVSALAGRIAIQLDRPDRYAYAWLSSAAYRQAIAEGASLDHLPLSLEAITDRDPQPERWALRRLLSYAQQANDDAAIISYAAQLRALVTSAIDAATLALRGAEASLRLQQWDDGELLLDEAVRLVPEHLVALSMRAEFLEARGKTALAAEAYDALGQASCMPAHKVAAWQHAAELYETGLDADQPVEDAAPADVEGTTERVIACLEQVVRLDTSQLGAQTRLRELYLKHGKLEALETLLTQQLLWADNTERRAELEVERAHLLLKLDRADEARLGLERAIALIPDREETLALFAELLVARGEYEEAEQHLVKLAASSTDDARALDAYRRLASLYETALEQPTRAEVAYREVLRRNPNDPAGDNLVAVLLRLDNPTAAVEVLLDLIERSKDTAYEKSRSLELARIYDAALKERRRAEEVLEKARRRWPNDRAVLRALADFFQRGKDHAAHAALLDRSLAEARRALASGRFEASFFEVIATVGDLRESPDLSRVADATLAAMSANHFPISGLGVRAANETFADLLAPEVLSLPLRALLRRTGWALSAVTRVDLRSMRATPLGEQAPSLAEHLATLARSFGLGEIASYVSPALGTVCQPLGHQPPALVVGPGFVALTDDSLIDALAMRALRILSTNTTALSNTSPVDLWPLLAAYLCAHLPTYVPQGVDPKRLEQLKAPMLQVLPKHLDTDLPMLAADVASTIGNRASQLGVAVQQWGSRTALLALGDPCSVLCAIAAASGQQDRYLGSAEERMKWLVRNPEARDIAVYSVTESYLEARARGRA